MPRLKEETPRKNEAVLIRITPRMKRRLSRAAKKNESTISDIGRKAFAKYFGVSEE